MLTKNRRMYTEGHQVASHTWSHPDLCNITSDQRKNEMYKNEMALRNIIGVIPTYMRPPYSSCTLGIPPSHHWNCGDWHKYRVRVRDRHGSPRLPHHLLCTSPSSLLPSLSHFPLHLPYLSLFPLTNSPQDLDTQDYLNDSPSLITNSQNIFTSALSGKSPATNDFLVISHDIHNQTSQVLVEFMLQSLTSAGYNPVTVGTCLGDPAANWYRTDTSATLG